MRRLVAVVLSSMLVLAGCTGPDATPTPSATSPTASGRLTVPDGQVTFPRPFQAARLVEAEVLTNYPADTVVTSARLESPLFADSPPRDTPVRLNPDWTNPVRLPLGTAVCPAPAGDSTIVLEMTVDGRAVTETLTADDTVLRQINADECAEQAILDVATPSFGPITAQDASRIETTIVLTRGGSQTDDPVTLAEMTGNIIFIVRPDASQSTLAAGQDSVAIPAVVEIGRCDPHVFAESKKTWVFPAYLAIGDADPAYVEIQPDETTRAAFKKLFDDCGEAERAN